MAINPTAYAEAAAGLTRLPFLGGTALHFKLHEEIERLQNEGSWLRNSGRNSKTLAKYPDLHVVLMLMKPNTRLGRHHVDGRMSIQLLQGRIRVQLPAQDIELRTGDLLTLDYGVLHNVQALEESSFLITISWPGGSKEERHARQRAS